MKRLTYLFFFFLPWKWRRIILIRVYRFELHPTSYIGLSWILPKKLIMGPGARIGHLTVCKNLEVMQIKAHSRIGNGNWITGFCVPRNSRNFNLTHFAHRTERRSILILEEHAAITHRHIIDCTDAVYIDKFATLAGYASQILTHSIDIKNNRQTCESVTIGAYSFIGTNSVILGGSALPSYSVLGAKSLLNKVYDKSYYLYGGVPARPINEISPESYYFHRESGFVI